MCIRDRPYTGCAVAGRASAALTRGAASAAAACTKMTTLAGAARTGTTRARTACRASALTRRARRRRQQALERPQLAVFAVLQVCLLYTSYGAVIAYLLKPVCNTIESFLRRFIPEKMHGLVNVLSITLTILFGLLLIYALCMMIIPDVYKRQGPDRPE